VRDGGRPFVLGGCCTLLAGALAGARDALGTIGLIYVDGHLDFYDGVTSPTGEAADMPVAVVLGDGPPPWVERVAPVPVTPANGIAILGYHDPDELADLGAQLAVNRAAGLFDADVATIRRDGPTATAAAALDHVHRASDRVWLHIDVDVLDQAILPATDYLMSGGLDWDELVELLRPVAADPGLVGWSIACYNPEKDPGGADGRAIVAAMERLFGRSEGN
jgi:arginase